MNRILIALTLLLLTMSCRQETFTFIENEDGLALSEGGKPVFFYRKKPKSKTGEYVCNNYIHPLFDLKGDTLTEEFPADHLFHRGVFWGWHQLFLNDQNLGDGWINDSISYDVTGAEGKTENGKAILSMKVLWKSRSLSEPFIEEQSSVTVFSQENGMRKTDFEITLKPLINGIKIGGSDDEKGYGGFCARIRMPEDITFTSEKGIIEPQNLQLSAGPWMDFSASFGNKGKSGLAILCHPSDPGFPQPWILRRKGSMQNAVFPGREKFLLDKPLTLRYRIIIHNGGAESLDIVKLQKEYEGIEFQP
jgi:hypothetical protein